MTDMRSPAGGTQPAGLNLSAIASLPLPTRTAFARDPQTPPLTLIRLAADPDAAVRAAVAGNPHAPGTLLVHLARDVEPAVRAALLHNPSATAAIVDLLAADREVTVALRASRHPLLTQAGLTTLARSPHATVRASAARHPQTAVALLETLAQDADSPVIIALLARRDLPEAVVTRMLEHPVPDLRAWCRASLVRPGQAGAVLPAVPMRGPAPTAGTQEPPMAS